MTENPFLFEEQVKNLPLPETQQFVRILWGKTDERAVGSISPIGRDHVSVAMLCAPIRQMSEFRQSRRGGLRRARARFDRLQRSSPTPRG